VVLHTAWSPFGPHRGGKLRMPPEPLDSCTCQLDADPFAADVAILQKLMSVGASQARLGFLG
jgi:hypothetical protein